MSHRPIEWLALVALAVLVGMCLGYCLTNAFWVFQVNHLIR